MEAAAVTHEHHGPPAAHRSSRVEAPTLGMLLFIMSEVMIFGAFFTAYFFIRVVNHDPWPAPGTVLPESVAGVNTAILLSSSLTLHCAGNNAVRRDGLLRSLSRHRHGDDKRQQHRAYDGGPRTGRPDKTAH